MLWMGVSQTTQPPVLQLLIADHPSTPTPEVDLY